MRKTDTVEIRISQRTGLDYHCFLDKGSGN